MANICLIKTPFKLYTRVYKILILIINILYKIYVKYFIQNINIIDILYLRTPCTYIYDSLETANFNFAKNPKNHSHINNA